MRSRGFFCEAERFEDLLLVPVYENAIKVKINKHI